MILYRTCTAMKASPALKFVTNSNAIPSVVKFLGSKEMIDQVFSRRLPIAVEYQSRFGPPGFTKNVLYASEKKLTTLFEFGYHLLLNSVNHGKAIYASTFEMELITSNRPLDVSRETNVAQILDKTNYRVAHEFVTKQDASTLDTIKYPNVRDPQPGGFNYAIYNATSVKPSSSVDIEDLILIPRTDYSVEVQRMQSRTEIIKPVIR